MITRRNLLFGALAAPAFAAKEPVERPHILLMVADNLPAWVLGCYGNTEVKTPNIDRLSRMGTRFTRHCSAAPAPGVGRATLVTGRTFAQLGGAESPGAADVTIDKALGAAGYTGTISDAAGALKALDAAAPGKPVLAMAHLPLAAPYDGVPQKVLDQYAVTLFRTFAPDPVAANITAGKEFFGDIRNSQKKYAAAVTALDEAVGALINKVYSKKIQDDTVIIFTSSCGALLGRHGIWGASVGSNPPNMYEEAVITPMIWSWPGDVPTQQVRPEVVSSYDLLPTLCDLSSTPVPDRNLAGRSYKPLATGKPYPKKQKPATTVFSQLGNTEMARVDRYKLVVRDQGKGPGELYDLRTDGSERTNHYQSPEFVTVREGLNGELAAWRQKFSR